MDQDIYFKELFKIIKESKVHCYIEINNLKVILKMIRSNKGR